MPRRLIALPAEDAYGTFAGQLVVRVPEEWELSRLRVVHRDHFDDVIVVVCRSALVRERPVAVKIRSSGWQAAEREIGLLHRLRSSGNVVHLLGAASLGQYAFVMTTAAERSLGQLIVERQRAGKQRMSLEECLPLLADILRGVRDLDAQGIVHGGLAEDNILLEGGRPLLAGFGATAFDPCGPGASFQAGVSEFRLPPETVRGFPTGCSNNIWQVGAMLAEMRLGHSPMLMAVRRAAPELVSARRWTPETEDAVQAIIRRDFNIVEDPGFSSLDEDSRYLLQGMLSVPLAGRWDSATALSRTLAIASARGVDIPAERPPPSVTSRASGA